MTDVRAITVKQPWAWAIAHGGKTIENRSRGTRYRGTLLIHAGKSWSDRGATDDYVLSAWEELRMPGCPSYPGHERATLPFGAVVAVTQLVDSHPDVGCCRPWGMEGQHHLVLEDVIPLSAPVPCRGALGLWRPPADVLLQCGAAR